MKPVVVTLEKLLRSTSRAPETPHEKWFQATYLEGVYLLSVLIYSLFYHYIISSQYDGNNNNNILFAYGISIALRRAVKILKTPPSTISSNTQDPGQQVESSWLPIKEVSQSVWFPILYIYSLIHSILSFLHLYSSYPRSSISI